MLRRGEKDTDAYRLVPKGIMGLSTNKSAMFLTASGKLSLKADAKSSIANVQHQPEQPIFKRKDLLVKATEAIP